MMKYLITAITLGFIWPVASETNAQAFYQQTKPPQNAPLSTEIDEQLKEILIARNAIWLPRLEKCGLMGQKNRAEEIELRGNDKKYLAEALVEANEMMICYLKIINEMNRESIAQTIKIYALEGIVEIYSK